MKIEDKIAYILETTFMQSGYTMQQMADLMHVSRKTIYNWTTAAACPSFAQVIHWFNVLEIRMLPWIMKLFYLDDRPLSGKIPEEQIEDELTQYMKSLTPYQKEQLHYIFCGQHGSAPDGILSMVAAHLHTPLRDRFSVATQILTNYEFASQNHSLVNSYEAIPDIDILKDSIEKGREAIMNGKSTYVRRKEEE